MGVSCLSPRFLKTLMGRRKYSLHFTIPLLKYQQLWKIDVNYLKAHNPIEFHDLSPTYVSFLEKK
jgi:hypothetical protein